MINYTVKLVTRNEVRDFIEHWHYSKSINGLMISYSFGLYDDDVLIGAAVFGKLAMANTWKKYGKCETDVIELRRLCLIDNTKKFSESYFISRCIKWLKQNTKIKIIVSYADPEYGHLGIIYQASNFTLIGKSSPGKVILWNGKKYHDKAIRTKYKGELKPFAKRLALALQNKEAFYKKTVGKYIYVYSLM
jgi:hypothetical protein